MRSVWAAATTTLATLAMKISALNDSDGLDLTFTCSNSHSGSRLKAGSMPDALEQSMEQAFRNINDHDHTNMAKTLQRILDGYGDAPAKRTTLIVLTDGKWRGGKPGDIESLLAAFVKKLSCRLDRLRTRWFTMQFISFGEDTEATQRLSLLNTELSNTYGAE